MNRKQILRLLLLPVAALLAPAQVYSTLGDTYISQTNPTNNFGNIGTMTVGPLGSPSGLGNAALVQVDISRLLALGVSSSQIQQATFTVYVHTVGVSGGLDLATLQSSWSESTATYNAAPTPSGAVQSNVPVSGSNGYVTFDITSVLQAWVTTPSSNNGLQITAALAQPGTQVILDTKESTTTSHPAFIDVVLAATGTVGPTGPMGLPGATGATGSAGANGTVGPTGAAGPSGAAGASGATGPAGANGTVGPTGAAGPSGAAGASGATGPAGANGTLGPTGAAGPSGAVGASGATGPAGANGTVGPTGAAGPSGAVGANGATGPAGTNGSVGPTGAAGPSGAAGAAGATGAAGSAGATGPMGAIGAAGSAGATGAQGNQGVQGAVGPTGADGAGTVFTAAVFLNSATNATVFLVPLSSSGTSAITQGTNGAFAEFQMVMPAACTFDRISATAVPTSASPTADTITYTLWKANAATSLSVAVTTSTTQFTAVQNVTINGSVTAAEGDTFAIGFSQNNGAPTIKSTVSVRCI